MQVYTEAEGEVPGQGAWVAVHRFEPGELTMPAVLEHLRAERGARTVLCEGGPTLLRELVAGGLPRRPAADGRAAAGRRRRADAAARRAAATRRRGWRCATSIAPDDHLFLHYAL